MPGRTLLVGLLLSLAAAATADGPTERPSPEENILRKASVAVDGDGLLTFFRQRTPGDAERKRIGEIIKRLGADDFDDRERAAKELRKVGGRATPLVRAAAASTDAEVAVRAKAFLKEVDAPAPLPAVAAARLLARRGSAGAVPVLLNYFPFADDGAVEDEVLATLLALTPDGKADPALAAALDDSSPIKRAAAAYVLGRNGDAAQRDAVRKRLKDADAGVRWQAARGLLGAHDRAAVPCLVGLLAEGPFDAAWRSEELLRRLAGDAAPAVWLDDSAEGRRKCRDAWAAWWKDKGDKVDMSSYKEADRPLGYTLGVEYNTGRVWECDLDGSIRWEIRDLEGPMDAQVLSDGNVLIAEADARRVTERDLKGKVVWEKKINGEPNGCQRLADGNTFVSTYDRPPFPAMNSTRALEIAPEGTTVRDIKLSNGVVGFNAIRRARTGRFYYAGDSDICESDATGKYLGCFHLPPGEVNNYVDLEILPGNRFLLADSRMGRVLEVTIGDINLWLANCPENGRGEKPHVFPGEKGYRVLWLADVPGACGVMRLPNGHTLVGAHHKVIELGADGKPVWEKNTEGYVRRVYRR